MNYEPPQRGFKTFLVLSILGVSTFFLTQVSKIAITYYTQAAMSEEPQDVRINSIGATSANISFHTDNYTIGYVKLVQKGGEQNEIIPTAQRNHLISLTNLKENTRYEFFIGVGKKTYDDHSKPYEFKTAFKPTPLITHRTFGQVLDSQKQPTTNTLIYLTIKDEDGQGTPGISTTLSTLTNKEGIFSLNLEEAYSRDLTSSFYFSPEKDLVEINALGENNESAAILLTTEQTQPTPSIHLDRDNRLLDLTQLGKVQGSSITLPFPSRKNEAEIHERLRYLLLKLVIP